MRNKRAQLFAIYLVLLTLFMSGLAIYMYYMQQKDISNSFVSPANVLELKARQEIFEIQERNIIIVSARETLEEIEWNSSEFLDSFEERFFNYLLAGEQEQFRDFLFSDFKFNNQEIDFNELDILGKGFLLKQIYSISLEDELLKVKRKPVEKSFSLKASEREKINFIVDVNYVFEKEYLIDKDNIK